MSRTGGQLIVDCLSIQNVKRVFCIPGESYLAVLDALYDTDIDVIVCRQEGGAAMAAEATGKLTGRPGVAMVTRGPGATNAAAGVHIAQQDSTPMILLIGQVAREMRGRDAFQEVDYQRFYGGMAKWVAEIDDAARIPEVMARAFSTAMSGRPGPVVISLPEDMLTDRVEVPAMKPIQPIISGPTREQIEAFDQALDRAEHPFLIVGGSRWNAQDAEELRAFSERWHLPVGVSFRRQMLFDHLHRNFAGDVGIGINPALRKHIENADLIILLGARMPEIASQSYTLLDIPHSRQKLIHIHSASEELRSVYQPDLAINSTPGAFLDAVSNLNPAHPPRWSNHAALAHEDYISWSETIPEAKNGMHVGQIVGWLRENLSDRTIITAGAGNYNTWTNRFYRFRHFGTQVGATSGSMGYGLPAAIAAKLECPEQTVICFAGDGCFQMTSQEFSTAIQWDVPIIVLVADNGMYGTIRMHQEREYPSRVSATNLQNPDFAALARACGGFGEQVEHIEDFPDVFERAKGTNVASLIHLKIDPEAITPTTTLSALRDRSHK